MFERFRRSRADDDADGLDTRRDRDTVGDGDRHGGGLVRDEFGGINWGSAFFGWLAAVGIAALLTALLAAAGTAIGLTEISGDEARSNAETIGIGGGILLVLVLMLAYFCGGYVAGRMSRLDGGRQGLGVWIIGLLATIVLAIVGAIGGSEYNLFSQLDLPRIPIDEGDLTSGAVIALIAVLLGTLLAALAGGKAGQRYHRRFDRALGRPAAV